MGRTSDSSWTLLGLSWGGLGLLLGTSWPLLLLSWALLGRCWAVLGTLLGALGAILGRSRPSYGPSWATLCDFPALCLSSNACALIFSRFSDSFRMIFLLEMRSCNHPLSISLCCAAGCAQHMESARRLARACLDPLPPAPAARNRPLKA